MRKACHICGGTGRTCNMKTCCPCKIITMHMNCVSTISQSVPDVWVCEDCSGGCDEVVQGTYTSDIVENNSCAVGSKTSDARKKVFESAKVKFLSAEEAILLTPGARSKRTKRTHSNLCPMPKPLLSANINVTDTSMGALLPKISKDITRPAPHLTKMLYGPVTSGLQPKPAELKLVKSAEKTVASGLQPKPAELKVVKSAEKTVDSGIYSSSVSNITLADGANKQGNTGDIKPSSHFLPCLTDKERCDRQLRLLINPDVQYQNEPVPEVCWSGMFGAFNDVFSVECGMQAHFAQSVLSKVYEFSKQMPKNLVLRIVPRLHAWPKIFLAEPPASDDIGLYFCPTAVKRSQEMYSTLLEYLDSQDSALQCSMENVELLVYTSAQLPVYSRGSVSRAYLFAVFRHVKKKIVSHAIKKELASNTPLSSGHPSANSLEGRYNEANGVQIGTLNCPSDQLDVPPGFENSPPVAKHGKRPRLLSSQGKSMDAQLYYRSPMESRVVKVKEECEDQTSSTEVRNVNTLASFKFITVKTEKES